MSEQARVFEEVVRGRRSLRAFLPNPVTTATLERVFEVAQRAPSNCNTQPWVTHVASGASLRHLSEEMPRRFMAGEMSLDFPYDGVYQGVYKERQYGSAQALYDAASIERSDKVRRQEQFMRNFSFFDAPHAAFPAGTLRAAGGGGPRHVRADPDAGDDRPWPRKLPPDCAQFRGQFHPRGVGCRAAIQVAVRHFLRLSGSRGASQPLRDRPGRLGGLRALSLLMTKRLAI